MDQRRIQLNEKLSQILGSKNVYFNPPESIKLKYPAILYKRTGVDVQRADNDVYKSIKRYDITIISPDPDNGLADKVIKELKGYYNTCYTADNLYHDSLTIYY